jgi:hypothetical protein
MESKTTKKPKKKTNYKFELWYKENKNNGEAYCDWENYLIAMASIEQRPLTFKQWLKEAWENDAWD